MLQLHLMRTYIADVINKSSVLKPSRYGYLTWEWRVGIRSFLYPLMISLLYKILQITGCDSVYLLVSILCVEMDPDLIESPTRLSSSSTQTLSPRIFHAGLAVVCDVFTYWLAREEFGTSASNWAVFFNLSSWFMFYCMSRTLINSLETVLTIISIYYFFRWHHRQNYRCVQLPDQSNASTFSHTSLRYIPENGRLNS